MAVAVVAMAVAESEVEAGIADREEDAASAPPAR
eukprot:CAMPEP_0119404208 /NCGR_PEP_ID=MMETSP1334-20130426/143776_1 /TAXON_ID=127549 /ORGANISM="Calcidiscus leptoporus, Strain RCC1130" /LENGTH=33 /DNA_ID= /DNA_START= /DNA_END= /DNA_ORIENTATION=